MKTIKLLFLAILSMPVYGQSDSVYTWQLTQGEVRTVKAQIQLVFDSWSPDMISNSSGSGSTLFTLSDGDSVLATKTILNYTSKGYWIANKLALMDVYFDADGNLLKKELLFFLKIPGDNYVALRCTSDNLDNIILYELTASKHGNGTERLSGTFNLDTGTCKSQQDVLWQWFILSNGFTVLQNKVKEAARASI